MATLEILEYPNPFLKKKAAAVDVFDDALEQIVKDMEETMASEDGIGLAATQVGVDKQLFILDPYVFDREQKVRPAIVLVNPEVVWASDETEVMEEGCLSFPGVYIPVERPLKVRIKAQDVAGTEYEYEGEGLAARAALHEMDHLNGVVMVDRVSHLVRTRALKKHKKGQLARLAESKSEASGG
jgi:peptide deformylase